VDKRPKKASALGHPGKGKKTKVSAKRGHKKAASHKKVKRKGGGGGRRGGGRRR